MTKSNDEYQVYNSMQRMWKQSSPQTVSIRLHKNLRYQKLHGAIGRGGGRHLPLPLDPPLSDDTFMR